MVDNRYSIERLIELRKLTRAIADLLRGQMKEYLATLAPLLRPHVLLGGYIQGTTKDPVRGADQAFKELEGLYETIGRAKPFNLTKDLKPPLDLASFALDMSVMEYSHIATTERHSKSVVVASPLKWALTYSGFNPSRFAEALSTRNKDGTELQSFVVHYLVMHLVISKQSGVRNVLEALHFPIVTEYSDQFGGLPLTYISSMITTSRPPDEVMVESTEVSGMDAFEEIVNVEDIAKMRDPLRDRLIEIIETHSSGDTLRGTVTS